MKLKYLKEYSTSKSESDFEQVLDNYVDSLDQDIKYKIVDYHNGIINVTFHFNSDLSMDQFLTDLSDYMDRRQVGREDSLLTFLGKMINSELIKRIEKLTNFRLRHVHPRWYSISGKHHLKTIILDFHQI